MHFGINMHFPYGTGEGRNVYAINEAGRFVKNSRERLYLERSRMRDSCVRQREKEREKERGREQERDRGKERERERERWTDDDEKKACVCVLVWKTT